MEDASLSSPAASRCVSGRIAENATVTAISGQKASSLFFTHGNVHMTDHHSSYPPACPSRFQRKNRPLYNHTHGSSCVVGRTLSNAQSSVSCAVGDSALLTALAARQPPTAIENRNGQSPASHLERV